MQRISNAALRKVAFLLAAGLPNSVCAAGSFSLGFDDVAAAARGFSGAESETRWASHRNPASSVWVSNQSLVLGATLVRYQTGFSGSAQRAATDGSNIVGGNGGNPGRLDLPLPDIAWSKKLSDHTAVGLSLNAPYGITLKFDEDWVGRYHAIDTVIRGVELSPSVSWKLNDTLSLGLGLRFQFLYSLFSNDVDLGAVVQRRAQAQAGADLVSPACNAFGEPQLPGKYDFRNALSDSAFAVGWQIGLLWQPASNTRVGVSYRSGVRHTLDGDADRTRDDWSADEFRSDPCFSGLRLGLIAQGRSFEEELVQPAVLASEDTQYRARLRLPYSWSISASQEIGQFTVTATLRETAWSGFGDLTFAFDNGAQSVTEPVSFNDSRLTGVGAEWQLGDDFALRAGAAYETSTVTDHTRTARSPDADRRYLSLGLGWKITPQLSIDLATGYLRGDERPVVDLAEASGSGNRLNGNFEPIRLVFGSSRLRWSFD